MDIHTLYAINVTPIGETSLLIDQITDYALDPGLQEIVEAADGSVDATYAAVMRQDPKIRATSTALATILGTIGISGYPLNSDGAAAAYCWFQKLQSGGTRAAGASHVKLTVSKGMILPRTLQVSQDQKATLALEIVPIFDLTNNPIVVTASQALAGSPSVGELFTVGPVMINGTQLDGIISTTVDFGIQEIVESADGQVWPTYIAIMSRRPSITITTLDAVSLSTFGLYGAAQGATDSVVYFRKLDQGGTRVADDGSEHISFTVDAGRISVTDLSGSHGQRLGSTVRITPTYDGSNAVMAISTTADIVTS